MHLPFTSPLRSLVLALSAAALLSACAITHVEPPKPEAAPAQFKETGLWSRAAAQSQVTEKWWTLFHDPVLDELQERLVVGNENLKQIAAQVATARAQLDASKTAFFPTLTANLSGNRVGNPSSGANGQPGTSNSYQANLGIASWEIDLWGQLSEAERGAKAGYQASLNDLAAARLSAQALLAQTYFSMRGAEAQSDMLERNVKAYQRSLDLTDARYSAGVAQRSDVLQAQTQLKSAQALAAESRAQRAQFEHAIAVLLGIPPSALQLDASARLPQPPQVPTLLPSDLLQRRPDIAAAQQRVITAYAQIGVADAAYFPSLTLSAKLGYEKGGLAGLLSAPNRFWSLGPALAETLIDNGARKLASAQARANADQQLSVYRQLVLTSLQEVEDNLVLADQLDQEAQLQGEARDAAARTLEIVNEQYKAGTVSYLNVVSAQNTLLSAEVTLLSVRSRQLTAISALLKNVAGRWEPAV